MTNRYRPAPGHHQLVDSGYHNQGDFQGRGGPFPHWYRGARPHQFYRGRVTRFPAPQYLNQRPLTGPQQSPGDGEWWKDPYGEDWDNICFQPSSYSQPGLPKKAVSQSQVQFKETKPSEGEQREDKWQRSLGLSSKMTYNTSNNPANSKSSLIKRSFLNQGDLASSAGAAKPIQIIPNGKSLNNHFLENPNSDGTANLKNPDDIMTPESLVKKDETICVETSTIPKLDNTAQKQINASEIPDLEIPILKPAPRIEELDRDTCEAESKQNELESSNLTVKCSETSTEDESESLAPVLEPIQSILAKRPVVKLMRLSDKDLQKYSVRSFACYTADQSTANYSLTKSNYDSCAESIMASSQPNANLSASLKTEMDEIRNKPNILSGNQSVSESLTVDPKVMPMSLVLQSSRSGKPVYKVFSSAKSRPAYPQKNFVKKSHVGQFDINKLKERFREAMPVLPSAVMKRIPRDKAEVQSNINDTAKVPLNSNINESGKPENVPGLCAEEANSSKNSEIDESTESPTQQIETQLSSANNQNEVECFQINSSNLEISSNETSMAEETAAEPSSLSVLGLNSDETNTDKHIGEVAEQTPQNAVSKISSECEKSETIICEPHPLTMDLTPNSPEETPDQAEHTVQEDETFIYDSVDSLAILEQPTISQDETDTETIPAEMEDSNLTYQTDFQENELSFKDGSETAHPDSHQVGDQGQFYQDTSQESEPSAADAAEGLLYLATSGGRIFPRDEECQDNSDRIDENALNIETQCPNIFFQPDQDQTVGNFSGSDNNITEKILPRSSGQCLPSSEIGAVHDEDSGDNQERNSPKRYQLKECSKPPTVNSTQLVVTQPSVIMHSASQNDGNVPMPASQAVVPQPTILVLGAVQIAKKTQRKIKPKRLKENTRQEKVLRPLLPKANVNSVNLDKTKRQDAEIKVSSNNENNAVQTHVADIEVDSSNKDGLQTNEVPNYATETTPASSNREGLRTNDVPTNAAEIEPALSSREGLRTNEIPTYAAEIQPASSSGEGLRTNEIPTYVAEIEPASSSREGLRTNEIPTYAAEIEPASSSREGLRTNEIPTYVAEIEPASSSKQCLHTNDVPGLEAEIEAEPELLDLSLKSTRNGPSCSINPQIHGAQSDDTVTGDESCNTDSESFENSNSFTNCVSNVTSSSLPSVETTGLENCSKLQASPSSTAMSCIDDTGATEHCQGDGASTQDRLKLLISNLRENLGKRVTSPVRSGKGYAKSGKTNRSTNPVSGNNQKTGQKAPRKVSKTKTSARKGKKRAPESKETAGQRGTAASQRGKLYDRGKPTKQGIVKVFYTRLRAKTEGKRVRERPYSKRGKGRSKRTTRALVQEPNCDIPHSETQNVGNVVDHSHINPDNVYNFETLDCNGESTIALTDNLELIDPMKNDNFMSDNTDLSTAVKLPDKTKNSRTKYKKSDGRRRRKGRRKKHVLSSLEEYKRKLGCEDTDDLPTILPPKRRRTQNKSPSPAKNPMEGPTKDNITRLAREFPRHNWLENKIKNGSVTQTASSETTTTSPRSSTTAMTNVDPTDIANDNATFPGRKDGMELSSVVGEDQAVNGEFANISENANKNENNNVCNTSTSHARGEVNISEENSVSNGGMKDYNVTEPFSATLHTIINNGFVDPEDLPTDMTTASIDSTVVKESIDHVAGNRSGQSGDAGVGTEPARNSTAHQDDMTAPLPFRTDEWLETGGDVLQDLTSSDPVSVVSGATNPTTTTTGNPFCGNIVTDSVKMTSDIQHGSSLATLSLENNTGLEPDKSTENLDTNNKSTSDGAIPLNLSLKPQVSEFDSKAESGHSSNMLSVQQKSSEISELLTETLKNGPPVLKVHPQVKEVGDKDPEALVASMKEAVCSVGETLQNDPQPQNHDPQATVVEARPTARKPNVPPIPALVPLPVSHPRTQSSGVMQGSEASVAVHGHWKGFDSRTSITSSRPQESVTARSNSADAAMSAPAVLLCDENGRSTQVALKRSSSDGIPDGQLQTRACLPHVGLHVSSPPVDISNILKREYNALERLSQEKEKELKEILTVLRHKKEEILRVMKQHPHNLRDVGCSGSRELEQGRGPEWLNAYKEKASLSSGNTDFSLTLANSNNNSSNIEPVETSPQVTTHSFNSQRGNDATSGLPLERSVSNACISLLPKSRKRHHRQNSGIDLTAKRRIVSSASSGPPQAHRNSCIDSVWSMIDLPSAMPSTANCPFVPSSTKYDVPQFCDGTAVVAKAHPAHSQQPFQTAGVIITAQPKDSGHSAHPGRLQPGQDKGAEKISSQGTSKTDEIPRLGGVPDTQLSQKPRPEAVSRIFPIASQQIGENAAPGHMTLPVASPTKFSPCSETTQIPHETPMPVRGQMLEYVDLRKSPENIVRRVPVTLPQGVHYGAYPSEKFTHHAPPINHGVGANQIPNSMHPHLQLPVPVDRQRRTKIVEHERPQQQLVPVPYVPGMTVPRPEGLHFIHQSHPSRVVAHNTMPQSTASQGPPVATYTPIRPGHPGEVIPQNQVNISISQNTMNTYADKSPQQPKEHIPAQFSKPPGEVRPGQYMARPTIPFPHPPSSGASMLRGTTHTTTALGQHPPQLVQALVSPPRMPHFVSAPRRMPDPRTVGRGQPIYRPLGDPRGQPLRHPGVPNTFHPETSFYSQRPRQSEPMQQFALPNPPVGHLRQPSPGEVPQGQFVELPRMSHPDKRPPPYHPPQQFDARVGVRQSPVHQNQLHQSPAHQSPVCRTTVHQNSVQQVPLQQTPVHQIVTDPFADRHQINSQPINRQKMPSVQPQTEHVTQSRAPRHSDFLCAVCHRKANMICSRCEAVRYCSKECQIKGWTEHTHHCKPRPT